MTLHKTTSSQIERVICGEEVEGGSYLEEPKEPGLPGIYGEIRAVYAMSVKYSENVEVFIKLTESIKTIVDPHIRAAILENISSVLSEIGVLASQIFQSDDDILKASEVVISDNIMLPTIKLRKAVVAMKQEGGVRPAALDRAVAMIDKLMDAMDVKTLGIDGDAQYSVVDRDSTN